MDFIITGFDPFGGKEINPSQSIVEALPDSIKLNDESEIKLTKLVLPTCCTDSWEQLEKILDRKKGAKSTILLMVGYAEGASCASLERVALNLRDYRIEDNFGHKHPAGNIVSGQPNALFNEMDLDSISALLNSKGWLTEVSNHAGTFVCNEIYFKSLLYKEDNEHLKSALFLHVPDLSPDNDESCSHPLSVESMKNLIADLASEIYAKAKG